MLSFRLKKQASRNAADTTFKDTDLSIRFKNVSELRFGILFLSSYSLVGFICFLTCLIFHIFSLWPIWTFWVQIPFSNEITKNQNQSK